MRSLGDFLRLRILFTLNNLRKRQLISFSFANNLKKRAFLPLKAGFKVGKSGEKA